MFDSLKESIGTEEFMSIFYNSWISLKTQLAKRNVLNTIWKNRNMTLKSLGFKQFIEQESF